jgi:sensitive to high expression protein 9, mitochondrial
MLRIVHVPKPVPFRQLSSSARLWNTSHPHGFPGPDNDKADRVVSCRSPSSSQTNAATQSPWPNSYLTLDSVKKLLKQWTETTAVAVRNKADDFTSRTQSTFSELGSQMNRVTGYEEIEALKRQVVLQGASEDVLQSCTTKLLYPISPEGRINLTRQAARDAKMAYDSAVLQRSNSQREVNDLLQRKSSWTDTDVGRFTTLVRLDHSYEQEEARAKATVDETEAAVETEFSKLMRTILARYHEEQVWSDKIRSASTYGSLAALGLNLAVFIMAIVVVEPWKRRRLAQTFERKIEEMNAESKSVVENGLKDIGIQLLDQRTLLSESLEVASRIVQAAGAVEALQEDNQLARPVTMVAKADGEVGTFIAATAVIAGVVGWLARSWLGSQT